MAIRLRYATPRSALPDVAATVPREMRDELTVSAVPGSGWYLALIAAWPVIGAGTAAFALTRTPSARRP